MFGIIHQYTEEIKEMGEMTSPNKKEYAERHGYKFIEFNTRNGLDLSKRTDHNMLSICWSKIPLLKKVLQENQEIEWFFWIDADAIFMNYHQKLENLVSSKAFFIVGRFCNGINVGTFFIRNCRRSIEFLDDIWNLGPVPSQTWWTGTENGQIDVVAQEEKYFDGFWVVPNNKFNSILHDCQAQTGCILPCSMYQPGDFIIHVPGQPNKFETLKECLKYVIK